jgi:hypothetical protein
LSQLKAYLAPLKGGEPEPLVRFELIPCDFIDEPLTATGAWHYC